MRKLRVKQHRRMHAHIYLAECSSTSADTTLCAVLARISCTWHIGRHLRMSVRLLAMFAFTDGKYLAPCACSNIQSDGHSCLG